MSAARRHERDGQREARGAPERGDPAPGLNRVARIRGVNYPSVEKAVKGLKRPLLMIHGEGDTYIKPEMAKALFDRAVELYQHCDKMGLADDNDVSVMIDVLNDIPREKHGKGKQS